MHSVFLLLAFCLSPAFANEQIKSESFDNTLRTSTVGPKILNAILETSTTAPRILNAILETSTAGPKILNNTLRTSTAGPRILNAILETSTAGPKILNNTLRTSTAGPKILNNTLRTSTAGPKILNNTLRTSTAGPKILKTILQTSTTESPPGCVCGIFLSGQFKPSSKEQPTGNPALIHDQPGIFPCTPGGNRICTNKCLETIVKYLPNSSTILCGSIDRDCYKERAYLFIKNCKHGWINTNLSAGREYCCKDGAPYKCPIY